jgi:cysteinyl-tRNA synthetase
VRRYLEWRGYAVTYVQNFTDIDDKILRRAREEQASMEAVAEKYIQAYFEDMDRLNIRRADAYPRATRIIDGIQRLIQELEAQGMAYQVDGDVYYAVRRQPDYGKLSGRKVDDLEAGASGRVEDEAAAKKQDPADFALWKAAKVDEPFWPSPWGKGRPGWHIECSAMVRDSLGERIDIHVGGSDLIFPHHENEIAQSEAVTHQPLANYWMHNGMVNVNNQKMSKSLGNFTTIRDVLDRGHLEPMALRLFVLGAHYRKPLDFTAEAMTAATHGWHTLRDGLRFGDELGDRCGWTALDQPWPQERLEAGAIAAFNAAMDDDINTAGALAVLFDLAKTLQRQANLFTHQGQIDAPAAELEVLWRTLVALAEVLGLVAQPSSPPDAESTTIISDADIEAKLAQRTAAKQAKNFAQADRLRDELKALGISLVDQPGGKTTWHRHS